MTRQRIAQLLFLAIVSSASPRTADADVWPMFRHDPQHTGLSGVDTSANSGMQKWVFAVSGSGSEMSPAIANDGTVYFGVDSLAGGFYAISPNGTQKWALPIKMAGSSPGIGADGTIFVGGQNIDGDSSLYAINSDGTQKWVFPTNGNFDSSPTVAADGTIYVVSSGSPGYLYAINPDSTQQWAFATGSNGTSPAIGADGTIYLGEAGYNGSLRAISPAGLQEWAVPIAGLSSSPSVGDDGTIFVGSHGNDEGEGGLYAVNPDGTEKWAFLIANVQAFSPAIGADGTIYVGSVATGNIGTLYAINPDGTQKWAFTTDNSIYGSPVLGSDGTIFFGSFGPMDNFLYAVNPDGTEKWAFATKDGGFTSSPAIGADGTIYTGSDEGDLYAFGTCDEQQEAVGGICVDPNHTPTARFTTSTVVGFVGIPLGFDAFYSTDPQNSIIGYSWDFGDGSPTGTSQSMSKIYNEAGTYTATLTVLDSEGLEDTTERQVVILPADQIGLFNSYLTFRTSFNRTRTASDRLVLKARVNIGDAQLGEGSLVAIEIAGERFEAILDDTLRASLLGPPKQKWRTEFGTVIQGFGEVELQATIKKADLGLGFNELGAIAGGDGEASITVPVRLEIGDSSVEVPLAADFDFNGDGTKARGEGASE